MRSSGTRGYDRGWSATLGVLFAELGGEADFAFLPRQSAKGVPGLQSGAISAPAQAVIGKFSAALASELEFVRDARELSTGLPAFDAAYQVWALPRQFQRPPLDAALAAQLLSWPAEAISPHSVLAWRDRFGLHLEARLPAPANWATVSHLQLVAEQLSNLLPAPVVPAAPPTFLDRVAARFLN
jgi:hypothetical protein